MFGKCFVWASCEKLYPTNSVFRQEILEDVEVVHLAKKKTWRERTLELGKEGHLAYPFLSPPSCKVSLFLIHTQTVAQLHVCESMLQYITESISRDKDTKMSPKSPHETCLTSSKLSPRELTDETVMATRRACQVPLWRHAGVLLWTTVGIKGRRKGSPSRSQNWREAGGCWLLRH